MTITEPQREEFARAAAPLCRWLMENCHPHCQAIVSSVDAELVEGIAMANIVIDSKQEK
jgi:hypothetical protein